MRFRFAQLLPLLVLGHTLMAHAQRNLTVSGFVLDPTGAAIPGATLRMQQSPGSASRQTQSGPKGEFSFTGLLARDYSLVIPAYSGFAPRTLPVHLQANISGLKVTVVLPSVSQAITVGGSCRRQRDRRLKPMNLPNLATRVIERLSALVCVANHR